MKLQYGMCIVIILIVALGVFWTSSPFPQLNDKEDAVFFNAVKKPNTESPKKPNTESPKKPTKVFKKVDKKVFKKVDKKVDKKVVDKLKQQLKDAKIKLEKTKPGSKARKDAENTVKELQRQLTTAQAGGAIQSNAQGGTAAPLTNSERLLKALNDENTANKALKEAQAAYIAQPTSGNKAALKLAQAEAAAAHAGALAAQAANYYAGYENIVAKAEATYAANPTDKNKDALDKAIVKANLAKTKLKNTQTAYTQAQKAAESLKPWTEPLAPKCVPSKGKPCATLTIENNSGVSQKLFDQIQSHVNDVYAKMVKDFPMDGKAPPTVYIGLNAADAKDKNLAEWIVKYPGFAINGGVYINSKYFQDHPKEILDVVAHEVFHAVQGGNKSKETEKKINWIAEGGASWSRDRYGTANLPVNKLTVGAPPAHSLYSADYETSARFLKYLDSKKPGTVISLLNDVFRNGSYNEATWWKNTFGQNLQTVYNNYQKEMLGQQSIVTAGATSNQVDTGKLYPVNSNTNVAFSSDGNTQYYFRPGQDPSKDKPFKTCVNGNCT